MTAKLFAFQLDFGDRTQSFCEHQLDVVVRIINDTDTAVLNKRIYRKKETKYAHVTIRANRAKEYWENLQHKLAALVDLQSQIIIVCEGDHGWEDYLLLYHYDCTEVPDDML